MESDGVTLRLSRVQLEAVSAAVARWLSSPITDWTTDEVADMENAARIIDATLTAVGKASEIGTVEVEIEDGAPVYRAYTSRLQGLEAAVRRGPRLPTLQSAPTWYDSVAQDLVAYVEWHAELRALLESEE